MIQDTPILSWSKYAGDNIYKSSAHFESSSAHIYVACGPLDTSNVVAHQTALRNLLKFFTHFHFTKWAVHKPNNPHLHSPTISRMKLRLLRGQFWHPIKIKLIDIPRGKVARRGPSTAAWFEQQLNKLCVCVLKSVPKSWTCLRMRRKCGTS